MAKRSPQRRIISEDDDNEFGRKLTHAIGSSSDDEDEDQQPVVAEKQPAASGAASQDEEMESESGEQSYLPHTSSDVPADHLLDESAETENCEIEEQPAEEA